MTPNIPTHVDASFYNRSGRRAALKAQRILDSGRGPNFTKPKKRKK